MKKNLTIREGILLLLAIFGLIMGGITFYSVRYAWKSNVESEYEGVVDDLTIVARQIDVNLRSQMKNPYRFLETTAKVQADHEDFSYLLRDSTGMVLSPTFAAGKELPISKIHWLTDDKGCCRAKVWGNECFVVFYPLQDRPLELVAVYDWDYMFADLIRTLVLFVIVLSAVFLFLVLLSWFWFIPMLERTIARRNRAENELQAARSLQQKAVTTDFPSNAFIDTYAVLQPAREVGGDIYRFGMQDGKFHYVIGDVSDKGTAAGLLMFTLSSYIHSRTRGDVPVCDLMRELNNLICDNSEYGMFCTLFLGNIDPETLEMEYCNAGHTRTLVNGEFIDQDPQLLAGMDRDYPYHAQTVQLHHGDRVLLYTDGVTEARSEDRSFFGEKRLQDWMKKLDPSLSGEAGCRSLLDTLAAFRGNARQNDDIAIIYIKIL